MKLVHHNVIVRSVYLSVLVATALLLTGCSGNSRSGLRTPAEQALYQSLNDSMQHLAPDALSLISRQMQQADDSLTYYDYYLMYGRHYLLTDQPDSLLPYVERVLDYTRRQAPPTARLRGLAATALNSAGAYHYLLHHPTDTVLSLYRQAYDLMAESDMKHYWPDLCANIGDAYVAKDDLVEAGRWYRRALLLVDSLQLPPTQNQTLYLGLGRIYTTEGDFEQAQKYYEMTEQHYSEMKPNMQSYFLNNYGNYLYYKHEYAQALEVFRRLEQHLKHYHAEQNFDMFLCKINMADVFLNLQQTDSATLYVGHAEQYFSRHDVKAGIYYAQTIRIGLALAAGRYDDVRRILSREQTHEDGIDYGLRSIRQRYVNQYLAAIGDYKGAYASLNANMMAQDSADQRRRNMRSEDIMMRLTEDTIRLHHQLELNRREAAYTQARLTAWVSIASLIILVLAFVLWYNHERKRKLQTSFNFLKLRLSNARQRISPHFVFNVLNSRMTEGSQEENDQLMTLARLIRSNLDLTSRPYVTLTEELDFVAQYVELERQLIGEDFTYTIDKPGQDVTDKILLPSMLVQILTENAILHGLKGREGEKRLRISVATDEQATRIAIQDNGPGFDVRRYDSKQSRVGLNIVRSTLAAINQENPKNKMLFDISNNNGCCCTLTIPNNIKLI